MHCSPVCSYLKLIHVTGTYINKICPIFIVETHAWIIVYETNSYHSRFELHTTYRPKSYLIYIDFYMFTNYRLHSHWACNSHLQSAEADKYYALVFSRHPTQIVRPPGRVKLIYRHHLLRYIEFARYINGLYRTICSVRHLKWP